MKAQLKRLGSWMLMHPWLVAALLFAGLFAAELILFPDQAFAKRKRKP